MRVFANPVGSGSLWFDNLATADGTPVALLQHYHHDDPPPDWKQRFLTTYASAHEDRAETTAHLLHLADITNSFVAAGLSSPELPSTARDSYSGPDADHLIKAVTQQDFI